MGPLLNEMCVLVIEETEKPELLLHLFASVSIAKISPHKSHTFEIR